MEAVYLALYVAASYSILIEMSCDSPNRFPEVYIFTFCCLVFPNIIFY